jgi:hypothetical protein
MRIRSLFTTLAVCAVLAAPLAGDEKGKTKAGKPAMDEKAMMEMMAKLGTPGEAHKALEPMVGTWDTKVTSWMDPAAPPMVSTGTSENRWIMGNRFIEQRFQGSFMDQPFEGIGYTGYDNLKKKYIGTWMDSMGTGIFTSLGTADASGKTVTLTGMMDDPMTGKAMKTTSVVKVVDNNKHTMEMWCPAPDGKPNKMMEIENTRKN